MQNQLPRKRTITFENQFFECLDLRTFQNEQRFFVFFLCFFFFCPRILDTNRRQKYEILLFTRTPQGSRGARFHAAFFSKHKCHSPGSYDMESVLPLNIPSLRSSFVLPSEKGVFPENRYIARLDHICDVSSSRTLFLCEVFLLEFR